MNQCSTLASSSPPYIEDRSQRNCCFLNRLISSTFWCLPCVLAFVVCCVTILSLVLPFRCSAHRMLSLPFDHLTFLREKITFVVYTYQPVSCSVFMCLFRLVSIPPSSPSCSTGALSFLLLSYAAFYLWRVGYSSRHLQEKLLLRYLELFKRPGFVQCCGVWARRSCYTPL